MSLLNLPYEILIIIIKKLDTKSVQNLYNTCRHTRNVVCMNGVVKVCNMSLSTMATAQSLKSNFFKDVAGHLQELSLCGVHDLYKTSLLPAMKRLKSLRTLNVAYTNICILDLIKIHYVCPTIKDITINFDFTKPGKHLDYIRPSHEDLMHCRRIFKDFENVHFVGSNINLLHSGVPQYILQLAKLNSLTYTVTQRDSCRIYITDEEPKSLVHFNQLYVYLLSNTVRDMLDVFPMLNLDSFEYIILRIYLDLYSVFCSQLFIPFFSEHFGINAKVMPKTVNLFDGNVSIMIWNTETMKFDDEFFSMLFVKIQQYFPCNFSSYTDRNVNRNDWFCIRPKLQDIEEDNKNDEPALKKRRQILKVILNYDEMFQEKQRVQLSLNFSDFISPITLSSKCNYSNKLIYLSLTGPVNYSGEFFSILFSCCQNLVTLNVEGTPLSPCALPISKAISSCQSLKNLRIVDKRINFKLLFPALSQCMMLENVHILDKSTEHNDLADPYEVFKNCNNLYYFLIYASMSDTAKVKKSQLFNRARSLSGKRLHVQLFAKDSDVMYNCDPFITVFMVSPIKEL